MREALPNILIILPDDGAYALSAVFLAHERCWWRRSHPLPRCLSFVLWELQFSLLALLPSTNFCVCAIGCFSPGSIGDHGAEEFGIFAGEACGRCGCVFSMFVCVFVSMLFYGIFIFFISDNKNNTHKKNKKNMKLDNKQPYLMADIHYVLGTNYKINNNNNRHIDSHQNNITNSDQLTRPRKHW